MARGVICSSGSICRNLVRHRGLVSRHFQHYCHYKGFDADITLGLFKVLMRGNAALWLDFQPQASLADMAALKAAFDPRYKDPGYHNV